MAAKKPATEPQLRAFVFVHQGRACIGCGQGQNLIIATPGLVRHEPAPAARSAPENLHEITGQDNIVHLKGARKERGYLTHGKAGNAASNTGDQKAQIRMSTGIVDKLIDIRGNDLRAAMHGRYGIALTLHAHTLAHYGAKLPAGNVCSSPTVHALQIGAKNKYLARSQLRNHIRCVLITLHINPPYPIPSQFLTALTSDVQASRRRHLRCTAAPGCRLVKAARSMQLVQRGGAADRNGPDGCQKRFCLAG